MVVDWVPSASFKRSVGCVIARREVSKTGAIVSEGWGPFVNSEKRSRWNAPTGTDVRTLDEGAEWLDFVQYTHILRISVFVWGGTRLKPGPSWVPASHARQTNLCSVSSVLHPFSPVRSPGRYGRVCRSFVKKLDVFVAMSRSTNASARSLDQRRPYIRRKSHWPASCDAVGVLNHAASCAFRHAIVPLRGWLRGQTASGRIPAA